jgi:predicted nucleic acid-binding protein
MKHVFVETNWVVDYCAPAHRKGFAAAQLLDSARSGTLQLHLPSPCLAEAAGVIRKKFQPREPDAVREYLRWAKLNGHVDGGDESAARRVLDRFEKLVNDGLDTLDDRLSALRSEAGLEVSPLDEAMLERSVALAIEKLELKPFDNSILAAVLVRAEGLRQEGFLDLAFCELDWDLRPWDKNRRAKPALKRLYDHVHVWVYADFTLTTPEPPTVWFQYSFP